MSVHLDSYVVYHSSYLAASSFIFNRDMASSRHQGHGLIVSRVHCCNLVLFLVNVIHLSLFTPPAQLLSICSYMLTTLFSLAVILPLFSKWSLNSIRSSLSKNLVTWNIFLGLKSNLNLMVVCCSLKVNTLEIYSLKPICWTLNLFLHLCLLAASLPKLVLIPSLTQPFIGQLLVPFHTLQSLDLTYVSLLTKYVSSCLTLLRRIGKLSKE